MGLGRLGEISDLSYQTLASTSENYLRLETLHAANDCVTLISREIRGVANVKPEQPHALR